jgi:hypothetical protein
LSNQLQKILEEFNCSVLNYKNNKIVIDYFYSEERYNDFLKGSNCRAGMGLHDTDEKLEFYKLADNTLIVIQHDGIETSKYKYVPIFKGTLEYKDRKANKTLSFKVRKNQYGDTYNFIDTEGNSVDFNSVQAIKHYLFEKYSEVKLPDWGEFVG